MISISAKIAEKKNGLNEETAVQRWMVMGMNNCFKCLHYDVCTKWRKPALYGITTYGGCGNHFKSKSNYVQVVHGRWVKTCDPDIYQCTNCERPTKMDELCDSEILRAYCPNCGADMRGTEE